MKQLAILGSTGSIGCNTLKIVEMFPDRFIIKVLAAKNNIELLAEQIERFRPELAVVFDEQHAVRLKKRLNNNKTVEILCGREGYLAAASCKSVDMVVSAMVGAAGLLPTIAAIDAGKAVALANKETLVMAGEIVMKKAMAKGIRIFPVDSEHSAIFQCLQGSSLKDLDKIILTGSGGPFLRKPVNEFDEIEPSDALNHPTWQMGKKISIDSATLMNKGLEVIEAKYLFDVNINEIEVVIHPQSIVHSMVSYKDGTVMAQLGLPDMKGAISYALSYPERLGLRLPAPNFTDIGSLTFEKPDLTKFPCLGLAYSACKRGGTMTSVLNAVNEEAVYAFLNKRIPFVKIPDIIEKVMGRHIVVENPALDDILESDKWAREETGRLDIL
ncbi:MAG: 1-deoxy-D-xylulose-5-phosphate reductoisomerase [Deltaproteobacteria bacterium]|nr:1-deoxy-D-xylulose-5-phosphate reductoisomerase [Deltaproteobacteria bacterium]